MNVSTGVPTYRLSHGLRSRKHATRGQARAHHHVRAGLQGTHEWSDLAEVVGVVGVSHDKHAPTCFRHAEWSVFPYPRCGTWTTRAPRRSASPTEPSVEPLSATRTSPRNPSPSIPRLAFSTTTSIVPASFRQGMTTLTSIPGPQAGGPPLPSRDPCRSFGNGLIASPRPEDGQGNSHQEDSVSRCAYSGSIAGKALTSFMARMSNLTRTARYRASTTSRTSMDGPLPRREKQPLQNEQCAREECERGPPNDKARSSTPGRIAGRAHVGRGVGARTS